MVVPGFQSMMRPTLLFLQDGETRSVSQIRDAVADALEVSEEDQAELLPSGQQTTFSNRVAWAITHMSQAGLLSRPKRGHYAIEPRGRQVLAAHSDRVDVAGLQQFPEYVAFRSRRRPEKPSQSDSVEDLAPEEAISRIIEEADEILALDLLDQILQQSPSFLERLALRLLRAMGYGGKEALLVHSGKPGDAGLDGIVRQDALGLDTVGVQAKRYDPHGNPVHRPDLQAFVGALQGAQTTRGVFVTTGRFTQGARDYAASVGVRIVLIDGDELTRLMVRYGVGVIVKETFELKQMSEEFFETS